MPERLMTLTVESDCEGYMERVLKALSDSPELFYCSHTVLQSHHIIHQDVNILMEEYDIFYNGSHDIV